MEEPRDVVQVLVEDGTVVAKDPRLAGDRRLRGVGAEVGVHGVDVAQLLEEEHGRRQHEQDDHHRHEALQDQADHRSPNRSRKPSPARLDDEREQEHGERRHDRHPPLLEQVLQAPGRHRAELWRRSRRHRDRGRRGTASVTTRFPTSRLAVTTTAGTAPGSRCLRRAAHHASAREARGLDVRARGQRPDLAPHDPGVERPPHDGHAEQGVEEAGPERRHDRRSRAPGRGGRGRGR